MGSKSPLIALALVVLVVFGPVAGHEFLDYDDAINITSNPQVANFSLAGLLSFWQKPYVNLYIPVTYNLWAVLAKASVFLPGATEGQLSPALFHSANLLLHLAASVLVFYILSDLCRVTGEINLRGSVNNSSRPQSGTRLHAAPEARKRDVSYAPLCEHPPDKADGVACNRLPSWAAWAGAVLFAIHPVQVEPVAWATGLKDVLSGFFSLLAILLYLRFARSESGKSGNRWWYYVAAALSFLLAMLSKPGAVSTPALAWIITVFMLGRRPGMTTVTLIPWLLLASPAVIVTSLAQAESHHIFELALWQRFLVAGDSISFYLGKLIFPLTLGPDYGRTPQLVLDHAWSFLSGMLPYILSAFLFWKGSRPWRAAAGIFVCVLLPVSGIVPFVFQQISTVADRYLYTAMLGPALALAWGLVGVRTKVLWGGVVIVLALFAAKSIVQLRYWHDPKVFYGHSLKVNPRSWTGYNNLGNILADSNQPSEAIAAYQKALAIDPNYAEAYNNMGTTLAALKQWEEAITAFTRAMEINPYYVDAAINLGDAYRANGQDEEAIATYEWALASGTSSSKVYFSLCTLYHKLKRNGEAASCYNKLLAMRPDSAEGYNNLGTVYKDLNRHADAIAAYQKALSLRTDFAEVYNNLGFLYAAEGKFDQAITYYRKASELYPDHTMPMRNMALAYIAMGQKDEAFAWLNKAIAADPAFAPAYNDLSRLYFAEGNFQQAVEFGVRARELGLVDEDHWQVLTPYIKKY